MIIKLRNIYQQACIRAKATGRAVISLTPALLRVAIAGFSGGVWLGLEA